MLAALWPDDTSTRLHLFTLAAFAGVEAVIFTSLYATLPGNMRLASDGAVWLLVWLGLMALAMLRRAVPAVITQPRALRGVYLAAYIPLLLICTLIVTINLTGIATAALLALLLWWRGLTLGQNHLPPQEARQHFWWGLGMVTLLLAFDFKLTRVGLLVGLALCGLLALILAQLNAVAQHHDISPRALTRPAWRKALGLVLLAVFALIVLDAVLLNSQVAAWVVQGAITLIVIPVGLIVGALLSLLQWLLPSNFFEGLANVLEQFMLRMGALQESMRPPPQEVAETVNNTPSVIDPQMVLFSIVLAVIVVVLLLLAGGMGLRRAVKRRRELGVMPDADTAAQDDGADDADEEAPGRLRQTFSRWFAAATIRLLYARMAREADKRGFARKPSQTAQEFLPALQQAFPGSESAASDVRLISDAYEAAHYGQVPDTAEQLTLIREAWQRVRKIPPTPPTPQSLITHP